MSSHAKKSYLEQDFQDGDWLVFGKESVGLSDEVVSQFQNHLKIPISKYVRSYKLANSVTFLIGEAKRQISFK
jgi:tRNA (cytidine/uridine-2'-O-)-methyltransferase